MTRTLKQLLSLLLAALPAVGITAPVEDRDMRAALIYDFSVYTSWPEGPIPSFNVCTFEEDEENINAALLASKKINGKPINFKIIKDVLELKGCQVLFIEDTKQSKLSGLHSTENSSTLIIVDESGASNYTGIINLRLANKRFVFSINNQAAKQANLLLSSKLLRLAEKVY